MTVTELEPQTGGRPPGDHDDKHAGTDDRCSFVYWDALRLQNVRCPKTATDTVNGELFCSPHADVVAGL